MQTKTNYQRFEDQEWVEIREGNEDELMLEKIKLGKEMKKTKST